jgi:Anthrone oxygenase
MFSVLQVLTVVLVAVAMALAHALELPGKMRLDKETYYAMQSIYYPGFTIGGGIGEASGTLATIVLLFLTPSGSADFWLTLVALLGLIGMQAVYWLFTHPVNKFWLEGERLDRFSSGFFSFGAHRSQLENATRPPDWTQLRDRWEYAHVARAGLALLSLIALVIAISCRTFCL